MFSRYDLRRLPWVPPGRGADEVTLVQNFLEFERAQLDRYEEWRGRLRKIPVGGLHDEPLPVLLKPARLPLSVMRELGDSLAFVGAPVSGRAVESDLLLFRGSAPPPLDRPVILDAVRRQVIRTRRTELVGEAALDVESWRPAALGEFLPPVPSPREAAERTAALLDEFPESRSVVEAATRAFAGSPATPGSGAGLDATLGAAGIDEGTAKDAALALSALLPPWEVIRFATNSRQRWAGSTTRYPSFAPYRMVLDTLSGGRAGLGHPMGFDRSSLLAGPAAGSSLLGLLLGGDDPVLRTRSEVDALASSEPRPEAVAPALSLFVWAHGVEVVEADPRGLEVASDAAVSEITEALRSLLSEAGMSSREVARQLIVSDSLRQGLRRAAQARARVGLRGVVDSTDLRAIGKSFADSVAVVTHEGRPSDLRPYLVESSAVLSTIERERRVAIQSLLLANGDSTPEEIWERVRERGLWEDLRDLEGYLDVLARHGLVVVQDGRRLSWVL